MTEKVLGNVQFGPTNSDKNNRIFRRSLFVVKDVAAGEILTRENVRSIRPGHGLEPKFFEQILGKRATTDIKRGTPLALDHVALHEAIK